MLSPIEPNYPHSSNSREAVSFAAAQVSQARAASSSIRQDVEFTLCTDEGDKVTLSMEAQQLMDNMRTGSVGINGDAVCAATMESVSLESVNSFSLLIEGDLNEEEQKDISKALKVIHRLVTDFMSGKSVNVGRYAHRLARLDELAGIEGTLSYEKTAIMAHESRVNVTKTATRPEKDHDPSALSYDRPIHAFGKVSALTDNIIKEIKGVVEDKPKLVRSMENFFKHYLKNLKEKDSNPLQYHLMSEIHSDLFSKIAAQHAVAGNSI